ncbi:MAG TPA: hypothetical protein VK585_06980 [Jiangellaceae bacterium]|nr:hypothetical protein [Jiangellaceae bacterium]
MNTVLAGVVGAVLGAALAVAAAVTIVNVAGGPTPQEVAQERGDEPVNAEDLAYGSN